MGFISRLLMLDTTEKQADRQMEDKQTRAGMAVDCAPKLFLILIDKSASMWTRDYPPSRIDAACDAALHLVEFLRNRSPASYVGIGTFADRFHKCVSPTPVGKGYYNILRALINNLGPDGNTNMDKGLRGIRRMVGNRILRGTPPVGIVLTDGCHTGPRDSDVTDEAAAMKNEGADIWAIGIGNQPDVDERILRQVASQPDQYIFIGQYEGPQAIVRTFEQIARAGLYLPEEEDEEND